MRAQREVRLRGRGAGWPGIAWCGMVAVVLVEVGAVAAMQCRKGRQEVVARWMRCRGCVAGGGS